MKRRYVIENSVTVELEAIKSERPRFEAISPDTKDRILEIAHKLYPTTPTEKDDQKKLVILRQLFHAVGLHGSLKYMADVGSYLFGVTRENDKRATCVRVINLIMGWVNPPYFKHKDMFKELGRAERRQNRRYALPTFKNDDEFYSSWEWKRVRYEALKKYGAKCMLCGATAEDGAKICVDHIKPRSRFPELQFDVNNLQVLCNDCNMGKGAWDETDWR